MMAGINYRYFVRGQWPGPADEKPAVTGEKFLKTLDSLSAICPIFSGWQLLRNWNIAEDERPRRLPLANARNRIVAIVQSGIDHDDFGTPIPIYGYSVVATAGARGPGRVTFTVRTGAQSFELSFGEHNIASDLSIVDYSLFKSALLAVSAMCDAQWSCAQAFRNDVIEVPITFGRGVEAFRIDGAIQVLLDPTFPRSIFHIPWIAYLSAQRAAGVALAPEILTERTVDGGLLMSATTDRLDPANPEHARRARLLAETMIACSGLVS